MSLLIIATACLVSASFLCGGVAGDDADEKLDQGLQRPEQVYPIFVRMEDQLFRRAGDYETFCQQHAATPRSDLRKLVLNSLQEKSNGSWKIIMDLVRQLEQQGAVTDLQRYWIVNGFACQATGEACRKLAEQESVAFVYRQRPPMTPPLHRRAASNDQPTKSHKKVYQQVLADWKNDSDQPVTIEGLQIPWNVERIQAPQAWMQEQATGRGVVVALSDTGLLVTPSLTQALWKNPQEEFNGRDDDGNGYVDDLFGYDFANQTWYALGDRPQRTHGSMCGGIIAGRPLNKENLLTGIAPRARLMVLRGMGLLKSYEYALSQGADILSMSYMFIARPLGNYRGLYRLAHEHLAAGGVIAVGGAGNFQQNKPVGQQIATPKDIPCVIAAAGILENGKLPRVSSQGPVYWDDVKFYDDYPKHTPLNKPDVTGCFGGFPVWGRPSATQRIPAWNQISDEGGDVGLVIGPQGNSFSGPHAAGVAALMLSVNDELNPWQVKQLMEETCTDIGADGHDVKSGAGLLNALAAVRAAKQAR